MNVLIVGAGPTGLVMAHELSRYGVPCRIVEKTADPARTSRAIAILPRTLEVFDLMGVVEEFLAAGLRIPAMNLYSDGRRIARIGLDNLDAAYPFVLGLPQDETERIIERSLNRRGVKVERGLEITAIDDDGYGVTARGRSLNRDAVEIHCDYLIACDGAHSSVRSLLGMPFSGGSYSEQFLLADIRLQAGTESDEARIFLHPAGIVMFFPMSGGRHRLIAVDPPPEWGVEPTLKQCQALLDRRNLSRFQLSDPRWSSTFRISHRKAEHFRHGRVFLAGDAAHVHSPMGAQGMNAGIQDAFNLAWKLGMVAAGDARPALLASYEAERMPVDTNIIRWTDRGTRFLLSRGVRAHRIRNTLIPLFTQFDFVRRQIVLAASQTGTHYQDSPLVEEHPLPGGSAAGCRAPDAAVRYNANHSVGAREARLFDLFAQGKYVLLLLWADPVDTLALEIGGRLLNVHRISDTALNSKADLCDGNGTVAAQYGVEPAAYLIRPDGYIAFRCRLEDASRLLPPYLQKIVFNVAEPEAESSPQGRVA